MRIIFFGSDDFAAVHLEMLLNSGHEVLGCVTGPDKAQGRGMKIGVSAVKQMALDHQLPCFQPGTLKSADIVQRLKSFNADIFIVVAYGRLLTPEILALPKMLCLNVHGSLLPKYRGAAPVNWAIINGDRETGVTVQKMALELDAGEIIAQEKMSIGQDENAAQLRKRMAEIGAQLLQKVLKNNPAGHFPLIPQDKGQVTLAPKLTKEMGKIDWSKPAQTIMNQVRGLQPWPGAYTFYKNKMIKITQVQLSDANTQETRAGQVININKNGFIVSCLDKGLLIQEVQPEAGKLMAAQSFVAGYKIAQGSLLGDC